MDLFELAMLKHGGSGSSNGVSWGDIKDKPFYDKRETVLRNTYEDWVAAGGHDGNGATPILSFIINNEIYEYVAPTVYNSGYTKVYNIPSYENRKYQIVAYTNTNPPSLKCRDVRSDKTVENWSIYPLKETVEIHHLDPKYIEDMYYTEKGPIVENLGNTYRDWLQIVGKVTTDTDDKVLSISLNGVLYKDIKPSYDSSLGGGGGGFKYVIPEANNTISVLWVQKVVRSQSEDDTFFFCKIVSDDDVVHKIPEKYYDTGAPFVITVTTINDDGTCEIDRTWDEIKEEFSKNTLPNHYIIINPTIPFPLEVFVCEKTVSSDEITNLSFAGNLVQGIVPTSASSQKQSMLIQLQALAYQLKIASTKATFNFKAGKSNLIYNVTAFFQKNSKNEIYSNSSLFHSLQNIEEDGRFMDALARVTYNNEHYYFESAQFSDNGITAFFFSTTANGIYRRLKVTPGETEDSDDIITIDKEIELADLDNAMSRKTIASGTIENGITKSLDYYSRTAFINLCEGTRNAYLTLSGDGVESEYELEPGGFYNGLYCLNYNGKNALRYSIRSTFTSISFVGDISDIINNNSKITEYTLSADQFNYSVLPRINIDETTIKLNGQGQLTSTHGNRVSEITEENSQTVTNYPNVAAVKSYVDGKLQSEIPTIPTSLKNPNILTIKVGDKTYTYDGSEAVTIEI